MPPLHRITRFDNPGAMFRLRGGKGLQPSKSMTAIEVLVGPAGRRSRDCPTTSPAAFLLRFGNKLEGRCSRRLVIEPNTVLCWALAKLREAQAPPPKVF